MRQAVRRRAWTALLLTGALLAGAPAVVASAQTPVDPSIPTPTFPGPTPQTLPAGADGCGSDAVGWLDSDFFTVDVPASTVNGVENQADVHVWDVDGSQQADALAPAHGGGLVDVNAPLTFQDGHTYDWYAQTWNGTAYSEPTATCSFKYYSGNPTAPTVTNPDFPPSGGSGAPTKAAGQSTTFTISGSASPLPSGCTAPGSPDCQVAPVDHYVYGIDQEPGIGAPTLPVDGNGSASLTMSFNWGVHTLYVEAVNAAGEQSLSPSSYTFFVPATLLPSTTVTLKAPATVARGTALRFPGQLTAGSYPADAVVHVSRADASHPSGVALPDATVSTGGAFTITDTPTEGGSATYTVTYPGDAGRQGGTSTATVRVTPTATALSLGINGWVYDANAVATVTAHLGSTETNRTVSIYAQPAGGSRVLIRTGTVDSHGNLTATYRLTRSTVFSAVFTGDVDYAPAVAWHTAWTMAAITERLYGYSGSSWQGSQLYEVYHRGAVASLYTTLSPSEPGACLQLQVQRYYHGYWHAVSTSACENPTSWGARLFRLPLTAQSGAVFRIRIMFLHTAADQLNSTSWGAWENLRVS